MKVAVLGANGFIGSSIVNFLQPRYDVVPVSRKTINLLDCVEVKKFVKSQNFDIIVNAAAIMTDNNGIADTKNNLGIFMNFYNLSDYFGKFINTGSGAEFDRSTNINIAAEENIFVVLPSDSYGFGQNVKSRLCYDKDNFYTLRIFNCFGTGEPNTRLFPRLLSANKTFTITNDRYFDYFSIYDLLSVLEDCIVRSWNIHDVNCVYREKYKISQVATRFNEIHNLNLQINVDSSSENNYTGDSSNLELLKIQLRGLDHGLLNYGKNNK